MWYNSKYERSMKFIRNFDYALQEKEYRNIVKELNLLNPRSLSYITGLNFQYLVKKIRNKEWPEKLDK